jgi:hypothetical protein
MFDKITIELDPKYYNKKSIVIEREINQDGKIKTIQLDGKNRIVFLFHTMIL